MNQGMEMLIDGRPLSWVVKGDFSLDGGVRTQPGGVVLGGNPHRMPVIGHLRSGPIEMVR